MDLITAEELNKNYDKYKRKFVHIEGYYLDGRLFDNDKNLSVLSSETDYLSIQYTLKKLKKTDYEGMMRIVGMPYAIASTRKNISYVVKMELFDKDGNITNTFTNNKIQLPKELEGKL